MELRLRLYNIATICTEFTYFRLGFFWSLLMKIRSKKIAGRPKSIGFFLANNNQLPLYFDRYPKISQVLSVFFFVIFVSSCIHVSFQYYPYNMFSIFRLGCIQLRPSLFSLLYFWNLGVALFPPRDSTCCWKTPFRPKRAILLARSTTLAPLRNSFAWIGIR